MQKIDVVRAWKDAVYRASLSPEQLAALPANPAGQIVLSDDTLTSVVGGARNAGQLKTLSFYPCPSVDDLCPNKRKAKR